MTQFPSFLAGQTIQFTFVSSVAPDSAPSFSVVDTAGTILSSRSAQESDSTHFYEMFTMPVAEQILKARWEATKTVAGSAFDFKSEFLFHVNIIEFPP